jgi:sulfide:quinone oxidoreductase
VTWEMIRPLRSGTAIFAMPSTPIKCPSVPQKLAYLAADWWRRQGVLENIRIVLAQPTPALFPVPEFAEQLEKVARRYGIELLLQHEMVEIRREQREVLLVDRREGAETKKTLHYDLLHAIPPHSAPDWIRQGSLGDGTPTGYVAVDKNTLQHVRFPNVFALGDAANTPNRKTAAAVRKQAPVVVRNLSAAIRRERLPASYDGHAGCPFSTRRNRVLMAEFDYSLKPRSSIPLINTKKERYDMWLLTRYGLVFLYWKLMLNGLA